MADDNSEQLKLDATQARKALQSLIKQAEDFSTALQKSSRYNNPNFAKFAKDTAGALKSLNTQMSGFGASLTNINQKIAATNSAVGASFLKTGTAVNQLATQFKQVESAIAGIAKVRTGFENVRGIKTSADALKAYQSQVESVRRSYAEMTNARKLSDAQAIASFEKQQILAADLKNTYNSLAAAEKKEAAEKAAADKQAIAWAKERAAAVKRAAAEEAAAVKKAAAEEALAYKEANASGMGAYRANMAKRRFDAKEAEAAAAAAAGGGDSIGTKIARQASTFANYALLGATVGGAAATLNEVVKLDTAMHNLQAITQTTDAGMVGLRKSILEVASGSRFMASEVADAATVLGQAGLSTQQIQDSLKGVVVFAQAAGIKLEESVNLLTSATSAFNLRADQTEEVANVFTSALNKSKLTIQQLSQGFQYSASAAAQSGVSFRQLTVIMELLAQAGIKSGSTIGTGVRQVIQQLSAPNEKFKQILVGLNLSMDDVSLKSHDMVTVVETLKNAGFDAADAFQAFGTRGASAFIALQGQIDKAAAFTEGLNDANAAANAAAKQMESLSATAKRFFSSIGALTATGFAPLVQTLQALLSVTVDLIGPLQQLGPAIQVIATGLALFAGYKAVSYIANITGLAQAFAALRAETSITKQLLGALPSLLNPTVLVFGALAVAVTAATYAWNAHKVAVAANAEAYDNARSKYETQHQVTGQLATATQDLLNKQNDLKDGSPALAAKIRELGGQFKSLGLDVEQLNGTYDQLLDKMRQLKGTALLRETNALIESRNKEFAVYGDRRGATEQAQFALQRLGNAGINDPLIASVLNQFKYIGGRRPESAADIRQLFAAADRADTIKQSSSGARSDAADKLYKAISDLAKAAQAEADVKKDINTRNNSIAALRLRNSGQLPAFENDTENLIANIKKRRGAFSADQLTDPVKYAGEINQWSKEGIAQLTTRLNATKSFAGSDAIRQAAVKSIQDQINQAIADLNVDALTSNNAAKQQRAALAGYIEKKIDLQIQAAQAEMSNATNEIDLKKAYGRLQSLTTQKYSADAQKAAAEMGLKIGDYSTAGGRLSVGAGSVIATNKLKIDSFNLDVDAAQQKLRQDYESKRRSIVTRLDRGTTRGERLVSNADIRALQKSISNSLLDAADQFKSLDKYAPTSVVKSHAQAALQDIADWYAKAMDLIEKKLEKDIAAIPDSDTAADQHAQDLRDAAEDARDELKQDRARREEEIRNRRDDILNDPRSRLPANMGEAYENIQQAFEDPRRTKYQFSETAKLFQDTMIAAVDAVKSSFGQLWTSIMDGTASAGDAFKAFGRSILQSMAEVISNEIAKQFMKMIFSILGNAIGGSFGGFGGSGGEVGPGGAGDGFGGWAAMATGGMVRRVAGSMPTRDSVPTMLKPGSFVMRQSVSSKMLRRAGGGMIPTLLQPGELTFDPAAVSAIGERNLRRMNAGGMINSNIGMGPMNDQLQGAANTAIKGREPSHTNVWVVKPDQQPPLTKRDILVTVTEDILANGQTKKMIKSVVNGG